MYIEFRLPDLTAPGAGVYVAITQLNIDIDNWVRQHDIQYHKTKIHKNTYRLVLKNDQAYSYFALTWNPLYVVSRHFNFKNPK